MSKKVKILLRKFAALLEKHSYSISTVYHENGSIRFIECRTPAAQKTFMIYLPSRYSMKATGSYQMVDITQDEETPSSYAIEFFSDMKGLLECDIISISSERMCSYRSSSIECYMISQGEEESEESEEGEEEDDEITALEKKTTKILQQVEPGASLPKIKEALPEKKETEPEEQEGAEEEPEEEEEEETEGVELVFETDEGEPYDEVKDLMQKELHAPEVEEEIEEIKEQILEAELDIDEDEYGDESRDNSPPPQLEESDVVLGAIYVLIDIGYFYRSISSFEGKILVWYTKLDENELEFRKSRLEKIKNRCTSFVSRAEERLKEIEEEEKSLKRQLIRLTIVSAQAKALLKKLKDDSASSYSEEVKLEAEMIYTKTSATVHELNMDLLKMRDEATELLNNYSASLDEMMEL